MPACVLGLFRKTEREVVTESKAWEPLEALRAAAKIFREQFEDDPVTLKLFGSHGALCRASEEVNNELAGQRQKLHQKTRERERHHRTVDGQSERCSVAPVKASICTRVADRKDILGDSARGLIIVGAGPKPVGAITVHGTAGTTTGVLHLPQPLLVAF